jgi:hypothetical protein
MCRFQLVIDKGYSEPVSEMKDHMGGHFSDQFVVAFCVKKREFFLQKRICPFTGIAVDF